MAFCSQCGTQADDGVAFCESCGTQIDNAKKAESKGIEQAPVFTPPPPTFKPPNKPRHSGPVCAHHDGDPAAASCAGCGKYICKDCCDSYKVKITEYAGKSLCYDCCTAIVSYNVEKLRKDRTKIITSLVLTCVGFIIGLIFGLAEGAGPWALVFAAVGACFWMFIKDMFFLLGESLKAGFGGHGLVGGIFYFIGGLIGAVFRSIVTTIQKMFIYTSHIIQTSSFIQADTVALQQMQDYMEYTLAMSRNKGVDLETLMEEDSELYNNSFAQAVRTQGEERATASMMQTMFDINERGEIIRGFAA